MKNFTKMFLAACLITGFAFSINAQSVGINDNGNQPNSSAGLDVNFTNKGFLPPRMTQSLRETIASPVEGLIIWCSDCGASGELQVYNGTTWTNLVGGAASPFQLQIGDNYQGGKIAYILVSVDPGYVEGETHGLIAAPSDQSTGVQWGCIETEISGADGTVVGTGNQNTIDIEAGCTDAGFAADICANLTLGGYSDWFLPSKDELNKLYVNRVAIGGFTDDGYWSSSERGIYTAWCQFFNDGFQIPNGKGNYPYVRAIRAF